MLVHMAIDPSFKFHPTLVLDCFGFISPWSLAIQVYFTFSVLMICLLVFGPFKLHLIKLLIHITFKFSRSWFLFLVNWIPALFISISLIQFITIQSSPQFISIHYHSIKSIIHINSILFNFIQFHPYKFNSIIISIHIVRFITKMSITHKNHNLAKICYNWLLVNNWLFGQSVDQSQLTLPGPLKPIFIHFTMLHH